MTNEGHRVSSVIAVSLQGRTHRFIPWAAGAYNQVYKSETAIQYQGHFGYWVVKRKKSSKDRLVNLISDYERFARKWRLINPHLYCEVLAEDQGVLIPFIEGRAARDKEIAQTLLDIYKRHGIVIVDAVSPKNFICAASGIVCIDMDFAFHARSLVSCEQATRYRYFRGREFFDYYSKYALRFPLTITVIRQCLYQERVCVPLSPQAHLQARAQVDIPELVSENRTSSTSAYAFISQLNSRYEKSYLQHYRTGCWGDWYYRLKCFFRSPKRLEAMRFLILLSSHPLCCVHHRIQALQLIVRQIQQECWGHGSVLRQQINSFLQENTLTSEENKSSLDEFLQRIHLKAP